jgi:hypothetical protein
VDGRSSEDSLYFSTPFINLEVDILLGIAVKEFMKLMSELSTLFLH